MNRRTRFVRRYDLIRKNEVKDQKVGLKNGKK